MIIDKLAYGILKLNMNFQNENASSFNDMKRNYMQKVSLQGTETENSM